MTPEADKDNIFDAADKDIKEDNRSTDFEEDLTERAEGRTCRGKPQCKWNYSIRNRPAVLCSVPCYQRR